MFIKGKPIRLRYKIWMLCAKMFIKGKPIGLRYKIWMLCPSGIYPYAMRIYCEKKTEIENSPLGGRVVWELLSNVESPDKHEVKGVAFTVSRIRGSLKLQRPLQMLLQYR
ncbi:hypothetical protein TNCV_506491 [Trichonephila clavipes]|nr:hypothetical protein TNCV_506491 [Trichonephila clavipes]